MSRISGDCYQLTQEEVEHFHRTGYITLQDVVTEQELGGLEELYNRLIRKDVGMDFGEDYGDHSCPAGTPEEQWKMVNVTLPSVHYPPFSGNIFSRRALSIGRQLYPQHGSDMVWEYDQLLAKKPRRPDAVFPAHQDAGYWYTPLGIPTATATCSLAINDATELNGCLAVVPGSHKEQRTRPHEDSVGGGGDHLLQLRPQAGDEPSVLLPCQRGSCTVHDEWLVHSSPGNTSEGWRHTYVVAVRHSRMVEYERERGFRHSYRDKEALDRLRRTKEWEARGGGEQSRTTFSLSI
jgi:hypothetical protein